MGFKKLRIRVSDLPKAADSIRVLQTTRGGVPGPQGDDDDDELGIPLRNRDREHANHVLYHALIEHVYVAPL